MQLHRDFVEMLSALCASGADFLIIGAHAMAAHDQARATQDIDIWVRPSSENASRVWRALADYGAPLHDLTLDDLSKPGVTFQIGLPPLRIDILTEISGVTFDEAWPNRLIVRHEDLTYAVIGKAELIRNKRAAARPKDLLDADNLEFDPQ